MEVIIVGDSFYKPVNLIQRSLFSIHVSLKLVSAKENYLSRLSNERGLLILLHAAYKHKELIREVKAQRTLNSSVRLGLGLIKSPPMPTISLKEDDHKFRGFREYLFSEGL